LGDFMKNGSATGGFAQDSFVTGNFATVGFA